MRASPVRGGRYQIGIEDAPTTEPVVRYLAQLLPGAALEHAVRLLTLAVVLAVATACLIDPGACPAGAAPRCGSAAAATRC